MESSIEQAKKDYLAGMKYKDIADKYDVSLSTVKSWKTRYDWQRNKKSMRTKSKSMRTKQKSTHTKKYATELAKNEDLTDKQKQFCLAYLQSYNATKAYQETYGCSYEVATANGPRLLGNARVKQIIQKLRSMQMSEVMATKTDAINDMLKISKSRIGDYVKVVTQKTVDPFRITADGKPYYHYNVQIIPRNLDEIDTSLIKSISSGRDGFKLDLYDKSSILKELVKVLPEAKADAKTDPMILAIKKAIETGKNEIDESEIED